ncbi:hypothetical protein MVEN_01432600 [Mycena venus]|uniref:Uncharacterized protein n=1 Tax=Mycena venus TaxID=2733690 RepID=A0A8H7CSZ0_9AGAR|nr:hypothetical protein MVEN_01432600 [Mycena venus]
MFALSLAALVASIFSIASALTLPSEYTNFTTANLSSLAATSKFAIASERFGTLLNLAFAITGDGEAVMLDGTVASNPNVQWILNNVIGSATQYTIQSAQAPTFLSFPGARSTTQTTSLYGQTIVDSIGYPTFTIQQVTPGQNGYTITENMFGGILTAWPPYVEGGTIGMATFQGSEQLGSAQVWTISAV